MGMTLRRAAMVAGLAGLAPLLFMGGVPVAEFYIFETLIVPGETAETVRNMLAHRGLFLVGVFAHLATHITDGAYE